jgi:hypothetical protein
VRLQTLGVLHDAFVWGEASLQPSGGLRLPGCCAAWLAAIPTLNLAPKFVILPYCLGWFVNTSYIIFFLFFF